MKDDGPLSKDKLRKFLIEHDVNALLSLANNDPESFKAWAKDLLTPIYNKIDDGPELIEMIDNLGYSIEMVMGYED